MKSSGILDAARCCDLAPARDLLHLRTVLLTNGIDVPRWFTEHRVVADYDFERIMEGA